MQLIIKPTSKCNFNCKFCSAKLLDINHSNVVPDTLKNYIKELNPQNVIVTGGDPLMMNPEYFFELLSLGDFNISLTSNLKDFYCNPQKWTPLFKNPKVGVITSFQYGNQRKDKDVYDENRFIKVIDTFNHYVGYKPNFIAVISNENESKALDHIYLAKKLNIQCKLNPMMPMGLSKEYYPRFKMFKIYLDIINKGFDMYELNCCERHLGKCNFNTNLSCDKHIRACYVDSHNILHTSFCEDLLSDNVELLKQDNSVISNDCYACPLFRLCNGCMKNKLAAKSCPNYCQEMLKLKNDIIGSGWLL